MLAELEEGADDVDLGGPACSDAEVEVQGELAQVLAVTDGCEEGGDMRFEQAQARQVAGLDDHLDCAHSREEYFAVGHLA